MSSRSTPRHESLVRLLEAAGARGISGPAAVAAALNESDQVLTNWAKRGVSKAGAMKAQAKFGCSALWILDGKQPKQLEGQRPPEPGRAFEALTADEIQMLEDFRAMMDDDREELTREMARRAEKIRAHLRKLSERHELPNLVSEANAHRSMRASTSVKVTDRLKQRSLLDDQ